MGPIGAQEMIFICLLALLLFGPKKLPELGRMLGKGLTEFRRAKNELKTTFESHMQELERETRIEEQSKKPSTARAQDTQYSTATYPYPYDEYGRQDSSSTPTEPDVTPPDYGSIKSESAPKSEGVPGTVPRSKPDSVGESMAVAAEDDRAV